MACECDVGPQHKELLLCVQGNGATVNFARLSGFHVGRDGTRLTFQRTDRVVLAQRRLKLSLTKLFGRSA